MILHMKVHEFDFLICECGSTKKLKEKIDLKDMIVTSYEQVEGYHETFLRIFALKEQGQILKEAKHFDFHGITWKAIVANTLPGFFKFIVMDVDGTVLTSLSFWKALFREQNSCILISITDTDTLPQDILLKILLLISETELGSEILIICDDVLPDCEKHCNDFLPIYRNKAAPYFLC